LIVTASAGNRDVFLAPVFADAGVVVESVGVTLLGTSRFTATNFHIGSEYTGMALYLDHDASGAPGSGNYAVLSDGTALYLNAISGGINFRQGNTSYLSMTRDNGGAYVSPASTTYSMRQCGTDYAEGAWTMVISSTTHPTKLCYCEHTATGNTFAWVNPAVGAGASNLGTATTCPDTL
jgi:hypothetical protein